MTVAPEFERTTSPASTQPGPLSGVRVLDMTHVLAGPYCTMVLADFGADVVKVENPQGGDLTRGLEDQHGFSSYFGSVNRNKRSVVLDLKSRGGREVMHRLMSKADVFVQNMGPGVAEKLELGPQEMLRRHPSLIYAVVTGYGLDGPWTHKKGVDPAVQALSGAMSLTGDPEGQPMRVGFSIADLSGGVFLAIGVLAAMAERSRSGKGQIVDVSLIESQMALLENAIVRGLDTGVAPLRVGGAHALEPLTRTYRTNDGALVVGLSSRNWAAVCALWERPDWASDPLLQPPQEHAVELVPRIQEIFARQPNGYWIPRLTALNVLCTPILDVREAVELPPIKERGFIRETIDSNGRRLRVAGSPVRLSRTPASVRSAAPLLGEHSWNALSNWLGMSDEEYARLAADGVFNTLPRHSPGFW